MPGQGAWIDKCENQKCIIFMHFCKLLTDVCNNQSQRNLTHTNWYEMHVTIKMLL